jgi:hypothetical protein
MVMIGVETFRETLSNIQPRRSFDLNRDRHFGRLRFGLCRAVGSSYEISNDPSAGTLRARKIRPGAKHGC